MSSTYLSDILVGLVAVLMALISNSSMIRLAIIGIMGEPIAAPHACSKFIPRKRKYVFLGKNSNYVVM